jgi:hypothetical protein
VGATLNAVNGDSRVRAAAQGGKMRGSHTIYEQDSWLYRREATCIAGLSFRTDLPHCSRTFVHHRTRFLEKKFPGSGSFFGSG